MDTDRLRLAVAREASATAHALTLKGLRRKTIPLRPMAEEISEAVEVRIEHLFAMSSSDNSLAAPIVRTVVMYRGCS